MSSSSVGTPTGRQAGAVAVAYFAASAMGLALLVIVARWLTSDDYARFLALWGLVFAFGSVLAAVEQEIVRTSAEATLDGRAVPRVAVQTVVATVVPGFVVLAVLLALPVGRELVDHSAWIALLTFVSLAGFAVQVLARAVFLGTNDFARYVTVLVGEAAIRLVIAAAVFLADAPGSVPLAAFIIVAGCFGWLPVVGRLTAAIDWHSAAVPWRRVGSTVAALAIANGLAAMMLTGYPAVATIVIGHVAELGDLFAVVTLSRVPLVLLAPALAMAVPVAVRWVRGGQRARLMRALVWVDGGGVVLAGLGGLVGDLLGPWATRLVMGHQYQPSHLTCALAAAATCIMAVALLHAAVLVTLKLYWRLALCWSAAVATAVGLMAWLPATPEERGVWGFTAASAVAAAATAVVVAWGSRSESEEPQGVA